MVFKKDGAEMSCKNCGIDLICRKKDYGGTFEATLQWQNFDGSAHYKTTDGKNFNCNIPEEDVPEEGQMQIPTTEKPAAPEIPLVGINEKFEHILNTLSSLDEMVHAIFRYTVDEQLKKK